MGAGFNSYFPSSVVDLSAAVEVKSPQDLANPRSDKIYILDGVIDFTGSGVSIEVPAGGLRIRGFGTDQFGIACTDNDYTLFTSPVGGSGNLFIQEIDVSISGTSSKVYDLTDSDGTHAVEVSSINYNNCTSLGEVTDYRQLLERNTGRFNGAPELTLSGDMDGYRIQTSIALGMSNITSLFKAGAALLFSSRFVSDINCDLPVTGALLDFSPANFDNEESLELSGCRITRVGDIDSSDTGITPNISADDVESIWSRNIGLSNTIKEIELEITSQIETELSGVSASTYLPLSGTFAVNTSSHWSMPVNGQAQLNSGNGKHRITGSIVIIGNAGDEIHVRVVRSDDNFSTSTVVKHISREIRNNNSGPNDTANFPIDFISSGAKTDKFRLEVENETAARNVTAESGSFINYVSLS